MPRSVSTWSSENPDAMPPPRVRLRIYDAHNGKCHLCTKTIRAGEKWSLDHVVAIVNQGANDEANLAPICANCKPIKDARDVAIKSFVARKRKAHLGIKRKSRPMMGTIASGWKRGFDGKAVKR